MKYSVLVFSVIFSYAAAGTLQIDSPVSRIINGNTTVEGRFPYAVSIQQIGVTTNTRGHICGGVLVTLQHVVTASSCLYRSNVLITASQYRVFAGSVLLTNDTPERVRMISGILIHPNYFGTPAFANDIAIVTLTTPFANNVVTPIALPSGEVPADFTLCTTAGWGGVALNNNNPSPTMRSAEKYIYNHQLCASLYNSLPAQPNILNSMICATSYSMNTGGCERDRGNALVCNGRLAGILSVSTNCQAIVRPEVYTNILSYSSWIKSVTGAASVTLPGAFVLVFLSVLQAVAGKIHL